MRFLFRNKTVSNKIKVLASNIWMCLTPGEGEKEIENHGWSRVKGFLQETEAKGQQAPRIGEYEPKLTTTSQVQDAHDSLTPLPFFYFFTQGLVTL